jgi:hypothetical protein
MKLAKAKGRLRSKQPKLNLNQAKDLPPLQRSIQEPSLKITSHPQG